MSLKVQKRHNQYVTYHLIITDMFAQEAYTWKILACFEKVWWHLAGQRKPFVRDTLGRSPVKLLLSASLWPPGSGPSEHQWWTGGPVGANGGESRGWTAWRADISPSWQLGNWTMTCQIQHLSPNVPKGWLVLLECFAHNWMSSGRFWCLAGQITTSYRCSPVWRS